MANAVKGEIEFVAGDKTYTLKLAYNARAEAEQILGATWPEIMREITDPTAIRHETVRGLLWAGLHQFHPELSLFDAGDLIDEVGPKFVGDKLSEAMEAAAPRNVAPRPPRKTKSSKAGKTG